MDILTTIATAQQHPPDHPHPIDPPIPLITTVNTMTDYEL
jgi:hypothetical protein